MNRTELLTYLEAMDQALQRTTTLYVYGSAACILLDEPDRTRTDLDLWRREG